jgi:hypothetical protein
MNRKRGWLLRFDEGAREMAATQTTGRDGLQVRRHALGACVLVA